MPAVFSDVMPCTWVGVYWLPPSECTNKPSA